MTRMSAFVIALMLPILTACQTTKLSDADRATICLALKRSDPLQYLSPEDRILVREQFSARGRDGQKMATAIYRAVGC